MFSSIVSDDQIAILLMLALLNVLIQTLNNSPAVSYKIDEEKFPLIIFNTCLVVTNITTH